MLRFFFTPVFRALILACVALCPLSTHAVENPEPSQASAPTVQLTVEEQAWIKAHPVITVAANHGWEPISFLSDNKEIRGVSVDYLKRLESILGIKFQLVRSVEDPAAEKTDVIAAVTNLNTLKHSHFTPLKSPYIQTPFVIFTRKDSDDIHQLEDLEGRKAVVFKTGVVAEALAEDYPNIQLHKADIAEEALSTLTSGIVDAYVGNLLIVTHVARDQGFGNIKVVGSTPYEASIYMAVRSDWPELASILQKGLNAISGTEAQAILHNWEGVTYERKTDFYLLIAFGGTALVIVAGLALWNWRQHRRERHRSMRRERAHNQVMEQLSRNAPLPEILHSIVNTIEQENSDMLCSIQLMDSTGKHLMTGAAPRLPNFYNAAIHGIAIGNGVGSCGTAAFTGQRVIVEDVQTHPYWKEYCELAARAGLKSCWSEPIKNASGKILGTFAIYHQHPQAPSQEDIRVIDQAASLAALAIDQSRVNEELQLALLVYQNSSEAMMVTDANGTILTINAAFARLTGCTQEEVIGKNPDTFGDGHDHAFYHAAWQEIGENGHWEGEIIDRRKGGETYTKWLTINSIFNEDGTVHRRVVLFYDITEKKKTEELVWQQANFDPLTGLPNRRMFHDRLDQDMKKAHRATQPLALFFLDLDHFKEVNDTLGHGMGDLLLQEAAKRLVSCVRESDTVARLGGDEFTVILGELDEPGCVERVVQDILHKLSEPFQLGEERAYVTTSIGITLYPDDATDIDALLKNADQAMYSAKRLGRNRCSYFTQSMQEAAQTRMRLANDLRVALAGDQFCVYYQPVVELATGAIHKAEALIRWQHPKQGLVSPAEFIPVAEETGLIVEIGDFVFLEAARQCQIWRTSGHPAFQVSVNKSPVQFRNERAQQTWADQLKNLNLPGPSIVVEITEGLLMDANTVITNKLLQFRDAGIQVALDDFGTGYSSLSYLQRFDIDYIKIDQSFVRNLTPGSNDLALCEAIIVMAHKLGMKVIAEGVETIMQRNLLSAAGCDYGQGYLFSQPLPATEFDSLLAGHPHQSMALANIGTAI
ncbi:MAG TPA: EAL domain-containing protein [Methylophilaceae bacterium]|nr:EAL domain-containing protein [Methylophilaceae bacterium]